MIKTIQSLFFLFFLIFVLSFERVLGFPFLFLFGWYWFLSDQTEEWQIGFIIFMSFVFAIVYVLPFWLVTIFLGSTTWFVLHNRKIIRYQVVRFSIVLWLFSVVYLLSRDVQTSIIWWLYHVLLFLSLAGIQIFVRGRKVSHKLERSLRLAR